jgi:hypothetical protein
VTGKTSSRLRFQTRTSSLFTENYSLFYKDGSKIVPPNIGDLITARSLAYWSQDDGSKSSSGFLLSTQSFSEVKLALANQGVAICATQLETGQTISFKTKSEAAAFFECSQRTISRRCEDGKPYAFKGVFIL